MASHIKLRQDTAANWTSTNPTLVLGEVGFETDTKRKKTGDGTTAWTSLAYDLTRAELAALATGIAKVTTSTGAVSIAVSGTDFKTINSTSILGSGDIVISGGGTPTIQAITGADTINGTAGIVTLAAGTYNVNVPAATGTGRTVRIFMNGAGVVSLVRNGTDTIGGQTTVFLVGANDWCEITDQASGNWALENRMLLDDLQVFSRDIKRTFLANLTVTGFRAQDVGASIRYNSANTSDGTTLAGGSERVTSGAWIQMGPIVIPAALNTVPWGVAWKATLPVAASGTNCQLAFATTGASTAGIAVDDEWNSDHTHIALRVGTAAAVVSSFVNDGLEHIYAVTFDVTTVKMFVDGTQVASSTTLTSMTGTGSYPMWLSSTGLYINARYVAWAW